MNKEPHHETMKQFARRLARQLKERKVAQMKKLQAEKAALAQTVVVHTLGYRDGKVGPVRDEVPRAEALRRLAGTDAERRLRDDPGLIVVCLMEPDLLRHWLSPEEFRLVTHLTDLDRKS